MVSSLAGCLHSLGHRVCDVIPILDVGNITIVGLLILWGLWLHDCRIRTWATVLCIVLAWLPLGVSRLELISRGSRPYGLCRHYCHLPVSGAFCSLGLVAMACLLLLVTLLALPMSTRLRGCAILGMVVLGG